MRTYKLQTKSKLHYALASIVILAATAFTTSHATDSPDYHPADLYKGYCGYGDITIHVKGKKEVVSCANLDTYTGKGYFYRQMCYTKDHGKYGYDKDRKHYRKHCERVKHRYQLPIIGVEKRAYKHKRVISRKNSPEFNFGIRTNGGYDHNFKLRSTQKKYFIAKRDTYTIAEHAPRYKTKIVCDGREYYDYKVNVKVSKAGQRVKCVFHNTKKYYDDRKKDDHKKPSRDHNKKPPTDHKRACTATGYTIRDAKDAYSYACPHKPRVDCDPIKRNKWMCSSAVIGNNAPARN